MIVLDEAGMVGTQQLKRIAEGLRRRGCKLVLIGDPEQLQPIEAGTPFRSILQKVGATQLKQIRRQKVDWQRQASSDLALGQVETALRAYEEKGCVRNTEDRSSAISALVEDYAADLSANRDKSRLALAHRRKDVHAINQAVRAARKDNDHSFGRTEVLLQTQHGPRAFAAGDRLLFTSNDHHLGVRNGMLATVLETETDKLTVRFDEGDGKRKPDLSFNPAEFSAIDHGYAVTVHRAQGCTVDKAYVLSSKTLDNHLAYVALTRHREEMNFYSSPHIRRTQHHSCQQDPRVETQSQPECDGCYKRYG